MTFDLPVLLKEENITYEVFADADYMPAVKLFFSNSEDLLAFKLKYGL